MVDDDANAQRWRELEAWGRDTRLNELDALMWRTDRHPEAAWSGAVLQLLDRAPDWERLRAAHEWFVKVVPRFAQRVVDPALPVGTPMWADDPGFDLDFHVRRVRLAEPGTRRQLLDLVQTIALTPLDRTRPPWESIVVEGLEGGRAAYVMHAHHVFMDGMALARLHERVLNASREHDPDKPLPPVAPSEDLSPLGVATKELARQAHDTPGAATKLARTLARSVRSPSSALRYARSLGRVASPPPANRSQVLRGGHQRMWRFGTLECELTDLKRAGKAAGGTVNDAFVCALLGGLRHYCGAFGEDLPDVPISMPVAMRSPDEASKGGNKFAGAFFLVPSGIADPAARIRAMHERVEQVRGEPALDFLSTLTPVLNRTPSAFAATVLQSVGGAVLTTSSWPGIQEERYMAGAKFERMFVFAPLPGTALTGAMCTHLGVCCIGINVDGEVFADLDLLWGCMQQGLDEVLGLADERHDP
jgi:WS/DGAT/MGAT family acyltransferase